jgi:SAM-dependent methyltransferase
MYKTFMYNNFNKKFEKFKRLIIERKYEKLIKYNIDSIINYIKKTKTKISIKDLLFDFLHSRDNYFSSSHMKNNFKSKLDFKYYNFIYNFIIKLDDISESSMYHFINTITTINGGHKILEKIKNNKKINIIKILKNQINPMVVKENAATYGTLLNFLWWNKNFPEENFNIPFYKKILMNSFRNSDDRIYKYLLKEIINPLPNSLKEKYLDTHVINQIIRNSFCYHIPEKYSLRRIKELSKYYDLNPYFNILMESVYLNKSVNTLMKYYYSENKILLSNMSSYENLNINVFNENEKNIIDFNNKLKTDYEKNLFYISRFICNKDLTFLNNKIKLIPIKNFWKLNLNYRNILGSIWNTIGQKIWSSQAIKSSTCVVNKFYCMQKNDYIMSINILKFLSNYNYSSFGASELFGYKLYSIELVFFILPFFKFIRINNNIFKSSKSHMILLGNRLMHHFRIYIRKYKKKHKINRKIRYYPILNEVVNFKPNPKKKVLKNGSLKYNLNKQKFNKVPPYHLHFNELKYIDNFLIRTKADGVITYNLPIEIYPNNLEIKNYRIKAEFIDELDLYLVFDIDIPYMNIKDRYMFLRKNHFITRNTSLTNLYSYENLITEISEERKIFSEFLKKPYKSFRWYPKASWNVKNISEEFRIDIINNVILEKNKDFICNSISYQNDGLILVPLNGKREIKVKPKSLMSIDLLYLKNKWYDNDGKEWTSIVESNKKIDNNTIWRLYPNQNNNKFIIGDFRYDKKYPNPNYVVELIINFYKNSWKNMNFKNIYYENHRVPINDFKKVIIKNNYIFEKMIIKMQSNKFAKWLDFGCGTGKSFRIIRKYEPNKYLGIDFDINNCIKCIQKYCYNINNKNYFFPANLKEDWNSHESNWYNFDFSIVYDYMICNFSIMYFFVDTFWNQVNKVSKKGTKMMFNVINKNAIKKMNIGNSYLYLDDQNVKYYFEHVHIKEMEEKFISTDIIDRTLKLYDWKIIHEHQESSGFESYYTWYIIEKN